MTAGRCLRTVRAALFAAVCVLLAALGHVMMSGSPVPWWTMAAAALATGGAGWCLAGRERRLPLIVSVVAVAQGALHSAFSLGQSAAGPAGHDAGSPHMDAAAMGHMGAGHMSAGHMSAAHMAHSGHDMDGVSSSGMLAAHLLAALLCGVWLAYGERAVFRVLRALARRLAAPSRLLFALAAPPHRPRVGPRRDFSDRAPRLLVLVHAITSRGPPEGAAAV
ncbi:hypothetical protein [Streptomyces paludis]|uniref:Integral-membrane protein n=1 Tax=Streptomyces paludis TaxID=2282738 RepID=A0A345HUP1_9ACTN|nr:hypothetical protein [Streptomyces paludis]AXG80415.1 hypothetical protein DVK44_25195 [Streptomyces paludis]